MSATSGNFQQARMRLAGLVQRRMNELGMSEDAFMQAMGIRNRLALTLLLRGKANFKMDHCQRLAEVLSCDQRELMNMHLAQFHTDEHIQLLATSLLGDVSAASTRSRVLVYERLTLELPGNGEG